MAWDQFANDFGPGTTNFEFFDEVFTAFEKAGGNSMRLWVHITGANNPNLQPNGYCAGLEESHIPDMQRVLDLAYNHNIVLVLSLWSFDMLNTRDNPVEIVNQAEQLLLVESNIQSYIDNALIPMVDAFRDHPAVGAWEIFNEPEGMSNEFGWSFTRHVPMSIIQRFVNRLSGAIHRTDSDALVTNGTWAMYAGTDVLTGNDIYKNYYSDAELISAGGDADGTLDFYQIHYYDWMSNDISVMHHPASYWKLDKAILVGEFFPLDAAGIPWSTYYQYLYDNGYAGALSWQWQGHAGELEPYRTNMLALMESVRDLPDIRIEEGRNRFPILGTIDNGLFDINSGTITNYIDLDDIASDPDEDQLTYSVETNTNSALVNVTINQSNQLDLSFTPEMTGFATITIMAKDPGGLTATTEFKIAVREAGTGNLALFRTTVFTSSNEPGTSCGDPLAATDGDYNTRWSSDYVDPTWYYVDLGNIYQVNRVIFYWEAAFGQRYEVQVSTDATTWTTVYTENAGDGGTDDIVFDAIEAQYVRMYGIQRGTQWGYSLYEFEVFGTGGGPIPIPVESVSVLPTDVSLNPSQTVQISAEILPANATNKNIIWASNNESVATVSSTGLVTAQSVGDANITATTEDGGHTALCAVNVTNDPITPQYTLIVNISGGGTVSISPSGGLYKENTLVTITATPDTDFQFDGWSGDAAGTSETLQVVMDTNKVIEANFSVIPNPGCESNIPIELPFSQDGKGEYCWITDGNVDYINSWNLDLLEINGVNHTNAWSNSLPSKIDGSYYIHYISSVDWGHFEIAGTETPASYTLSIEITGNGTVSPSGGNYDPGTVVVLTATPDDENSIVRWGGDASGTSKTVSVTMDGNKSVSATFLSSGTPCDTPVPITPPFNQNGSGEYCWITADDIASVNSWNMAIVEINGVDFTNIQSGNMPAKQDGNYYIYYKGLYDWSHFEAAGFE